MRLLNSDVFVVLLLIHVWIWLQYVILYHIPSRNACWYLKILWWSFPYYDI